MRKILVLVVLAVLAAGAWWRAGREAGPAIDLRQAGPVIGQSSPLVVALTARNGRLSRVDISIEQQGRTLNVVKADRRTLEAACQTCPWRRESADRLAIHARIGKHDQPELASGVARVVVRAARPVLFGLREAVSEVSRDLQVRLEPPRVEVLSTFHYINQGGAELVVYRASPADVDSGVRVGDLVYRGFPGTGAGLTADPAVHVAFFALLHDQDPGVPVVVFARDAGGNEAVAPLDHRVFPKPFARSRIELTDEFLQHVVPAIAATTPDMRLSTAPGDLVGSFLRINGELRQKNAQTIVDLSKKTTPRMLWTDAFQPLGNAKVEAKFADSRTYLRQGREVDHQTHLGFDLAVTQHIPVLAANRGIVGYAGDLGIYGNCIVLDHGLGVQSLYGHLSSIDVKTGATVEKGQEMAKSGMTGLAGGDHLHFTMLVDGHPVNPVEWWDPKWMQDRVLRKLTEGPAK